MKRISSLILLLLSILLIAAGCTQSMPPATTTPVTEPITMAASPFAGAPTTSLAIREYVDTAALFAQKQGRPAALAAFNNRTGPFVTGDVYVYALDYAGTALALPFQPEQVGTSFLERTDAAGKPYTAVEIQLVKSGGGLSPVPIPSSRQ